MTSLSLVRLAEDLVPAVLEAGRIIMRHYRFGVSAERKSDDSPVTAADREAETHIIAAISRAFPGIPVVAEEEAAAGRLPEVAARMFLVDPLDGTREFLKQSGEFTVNVGYVVAGEPRFGIVYAPALGRLFMTTGPGQAAEAHLASSDAATGLSDLVLAPISARTPDPENLLALVSQSHSARAAEAWLFERYPSARTRPCGSSLKFCLIACGDADLYPRLGPTSEWDTAAGHAVLAAAGGTVTLLDGAPLTYGKAGARYLNPPFVAWARAPIRSELR